MAKDVSEPVKLVQDIETGDRFLVYSTDKGMRIDIRFEGDTLWMTQAQISQLFGRDTSSISRHISTILEEGELSEEGNLQKVQIPPSTKPTVLYNLDMVISVGYRVTSAQGTLFRRWATDVLVRFAKNGFVVDAIRLKSGDASDRIAELRDIIRDIRSDEANVYRELQRICSMCQDYKSDAQAATKFFQQTQAKLIYAVTSNTPSEIVHHRADYKQDNMGLTNWPNEQIQKRDVSVSKNYLSDAEIKELNRLTTILLDIFEDQAELGRLIMMEDARNLLDNQLRSLGRQVLRSGGTMTMEAARAHAERQYEAFNDRRKALRHAEADRTIQELSKEAKALAKPEKRSPPTK